MKEDKNGRVLCDYCEKYATRNIQEAMITWKVDGKGNYSKNPIEYNPIDGDNFHLCDTCEPDYD